MSKHTNKGKNNLRVAQQPQRQSIDPYQLQLNMHVNSMRVEAVNKAVDTFKDSEDDFSNEQVFALADKYFDYYTKDTTARKEDKELIEKLAVVNGIKEKPEA